MSRPPSGFSQSMSFLRTLKSQAVQAAARHYLNRQLEDYGVMTKLEIDSHNRTIHAELELKGEPQPIIVEVSGYELMESSGKTCLKFSAVKISREWMQVAFQQWAKGREFEVPAILRVLL